MTDYSYQLYSSRNFPPLSDTLAMVAAAGYKQVEGYSALLADPELLETLKADLDANGLHMATAHFGIDMLSETPEQVLEIVKALNIECVFGPYLAPDQRPTDSDGWRAFGKKVAEAGKPVWDAGLTYGWHNHDFEFRPLDNGDVPIDLIMESHPDLVMEFDLAWAQVAGSDPMEWVKKYGERIVSAHIKDVAAPGECADEDGWADVGQGVVDWPALLPALRAAGTKYFIMEHDNPSDHQRFAKRSIETVKTL